MADGQNEPVKPSGWLVLWFRDEKFWRDVASRTVSGLIVLLIGYVYAVVSGYIARPNVWPVAMPFALLAYYYVFYVRAGLRWGRRSGFRSLNYGYYLIFAMMTFFLGWFIVWVIQSK